MPPNTVRVDRATKWGNPFHTHGDGYPMSRQLAARAFDDHLRICETYFSGDARARIPSRPLVTVDDIRRKLRGKNLACWCPLDEPCHADTLLQIANADPTGVRV